MMYDVCVIGLLQPARQCVLLYSVFEVTKCMPMRSGRNDASCENISNSWNAERPRVAGRSWRVWQTVVDKIGVKHCRFQVVSGPANQVHVAYKTLQFIIQLAYTTDYYDKSVFSVTPSLL